MNLGINIGYDVFLYYLVRKIGFGGKVEKRKKIFQVKTIR